MSRPCASRERMYRLAPLAAPVAGAALFVLAALLPRRVALLRGNIDQDKKRGPEYRVLTLERCRALIEQC